MAAWKLGQEFEIIACSVAQSHLTTESIFFHVVASTSRIRSA
jgi:hypothetical protein